MDEKFTGYPIGEDTEANDANDTEEITMEETEFVEDSVLSKEENENNESVEDEGYVPEWAREDGTISSNEGNGTEFNEYEFQDDSYEAPSKKKKGARAAIIAVIAIVIVAAVAAAGFFLIKEKNPYNELGYVNFSGRTIQDVADEGGFETVADFLKEFSLPEDMPADTHESAAFYTMPVSEICEMNGMTFEQLKELYELSDDMTESTPWGVVQGSVKISKMVMEEDFEQFKAENGLGDDITLDTPWGEVRNIVEQKALEMMKKEEEEAKKRAEESEAVVDDEAVEDVANDAAIDDVETETAETEIGEESEAVAE